MKLPITINEGLSQKTFSPTHQKKKSTKAKARAQTVSLYEAFRLANIHPNKLINTSLQSPGEDMCSETLNIRKSDLDFKSEWASPLWRHVNHGDS